MSSRSKLSAPERLRGFKFSLPSSLSTFSMPASLEEVEIPAQPVPIPQPYQPTPDEADLIEQFFGDTSVVKPEPLPDQSPLISFDEPVRIKKEFQASSSDYDQNEWRSLLDYVKRPESSQSFPGNILNGQIPFDFIVYFISTRSERNASVSECFYHYINDNLISHAKDSSGRYTIDGIVDTIEFFNSFYENEVFNLLMKKAITSIEEFDPKLNGMSHHSIFTSRDETRSSYVTFDYHHYGAALKNINFKSDLVRGYFITIMKVAVAMSEIFYQLHLYHLNIQNELSTYLYFGEDFFSPSDKLVTCYHFMCIIAGFKGYASDDNIDVIMSWLKHPKRTANAPNNDLSFVTPNESKQQHSPDKIDSFSNYFRESYQTIFVDDLHKFMSKK